MYGSATYVVPMERGLRHFHRKLDGEDSRERPGEDHTKTCTWGRPVGDQWSYQTRSLTLTRASLRGVPTRTRKKRSFLIHCENVDMGFQRGLGRSRSFLIHCENVDMGFYIL
jgi:hypothetical protein